MQVMEKEEKLLEGLCSPFTVKEDDKVIDECCVLRIAPAVKLQVVALSMAGGFFC